MFIKLSIEIRAYLSSTCVADPVDNMLLNALKSSFPSSCEVVHSTILPYIWYRNEILDYSTCVVTKPSCNDSILAGSAGFGDGCSNSKC